MTNDPGGVGEGKEKGEKIILSYGEYSVKIKTSFKKWITELIAPIFNAKLRVLASPLSLFWKMYELKNITTCASLWNEK